VNGRFCSQLFLFRIACIVHWRAGVVWHIRDMRYAAVNGSRGDCCKVLLIDLQLTRIFSRVNMQIAEARENSLPIKIKIAIARFRPHMLNQPGLRVDLDCALKFAIMVGNSAFNAQPRSFLPVRWSSLIAALIILYSKPRRLAHACGSASQSRTVAAPDSSIILRSSALSSTA